MLQADIEVDLTKSHEHIKAENFLQLVTEETVRFSEHKEDLICHYWLED